LQFKTIDKRRAETDGDESGKPAKRQKQSSEVNPEELEKEDLESDEEQLVFLYLLIAS
jgi:hypothetical protein